MNVPPDSLFRCGSKTREFRGVRGTGSKDRGAGFPACNADILVGGTSAGKPTLRARIPVLAAPLSPPPIHVEQSALVHAGEMRCGTRPAVICRMLNHSGPRRVPIHVSQCRPQVVLSQNASEEPVLP